MSFSVSHLFKGKAAASDGLTQPQREAVGDLLHYCMYADNHIALAETKAVADMVSSFSWDPKISFEYFESRSIGAARAAKDDPALRQAFLDSIKERLNTPQTRTLALNACKRLFTADGVQSEKESVLLARISKLLG